MDLEEQYERLLKYCYAKVKNRELAEDITQESFLRFWNTKDYGSIERQMPYLYTIARNLCLDHFKKKKEDLPGDEELFNGVADENANVEENAVNRLLVERALNLLSPEDRELVVLCYVSGLSVTDAGKTLGISRFAVHRRLRAAKEILKKEMEGFV